MGRIAGQRKGEPYPESKTSGPPGPPGPPGAMLSGPTADRPVNPPIGTQYFDTDFGAPLYFDNVDSSGWTFAMRSVVGFQSIIAGNVTPGLSTHNINILTDLGMPDLLNSGMVYQAMMAENGGQKFWIVSAISTDQHTIQLQIYSAEVAPCSGGPFDVNLSWQFGWETP